MTDKDISESNEQNDNFSINQNTLEGKRQLNQETIDQLKNIEQEEKIISPPEVKNKIEEIEIKSIEDLVELCDKKERIEN